MKLIDYHIHSLYSPDSKSSIEQIARIAFNKGLSEIAITDHYEPSALEFGYKDYDPRGQKIDIEICRELYENKLTILHGIELGQPHHFKQLTEEVLGKVSFDYVLGSAHKNKDSIDVGNITYRYELVDEIIKNYLNELKMLVEDDSFDCVGHLDLIRRYGARNYVFFSMSDYRDELAEIFEILIKNGKGIEVNTSGVRQELKSFLPEFSIIKFYKELGGEIITVGSDAHSAINVGSDIRLAYEMIKAAGFDYIATYQQRTPSFIRIGDKKQYSMATI